MKSIKLNQEELKETSASTWDNDGSTTPRTGDNLSISTGNPVSDPLWERWVSANDAENTVSYLIGKILTIIDASMNEGEQKKAVKTLIKKELWLVSDKIRTYCLDMREGSNHTVAFPFRGDTEEVSR